MNSQHKRSERRSASWTNKCSRAAECYRQLLTLAPELNSARDDLRRFVGGMTGLGVEINEWSFADVERYVDLFCEKAQEYLQAHKVGRKD